MSQAGWLVSVLAVSALLAWGSRMAGDGPQLELDGKIVLHEGVETREQVLALLGPPDEQDSDLLTYRLKSKREDELRLCLEFLNRTVAAVRLEAF